MALESCLPLFHIGRPKKLGFDGSSGSSSSSNNNNNNSSSSSNSSNNSSSNNNMINAFASKERRQNSWT
ncbi:mCG146925 [Mus musculus]|nr:mCG146925 [Mus musculus]